MRVFVYGTLKPGECNYDRYCAATAIEVKKAFAYGQLFDLPFGYPAMTPGNSPVYGFVLSFVDRVVLEQLDELEDYDPNRLDDQNEYIRAEIETFNLEQQPLGPAWVYLMNVEQAERLGGVVLPGGDWIGSRG